MLVSRIIVGSGIGQNSASIFVEAAFRNCFSSLFALAEDREASVVDFCCLNVGNGTWNPKFIKAVMIWSLGL